MKTDRGVPGITLLPPTANKMSPNNKPSWFVPVSSASTDASVSRALTQGASAVMTANYNRIRIVYFREVDFFSEQSIQRIVFHFPSWVQQVPEQWELRLVGGCPALVFRHNGRLYARHEAYRCVDRRTGAPDERNGSARLEFVDDRMVWEDDDEDWLIR